MLAAIKVVLRLGLNAEIKGYYSHPYFTEEEIQAERGS